MNTTLAEIGTGLSIVAGLIIMAILIACVIAMVLNNHAQRLAKLEQRNDIAPAPQTPTTQEQ